MISEISILTEGPGRFLSIGIKDAAEDCMELRMIGSIYDSMIIRPSLSEYKGGIRLNYEVTDCISLEEYLTSEKLGGEDIYSFMLALNRAAGIMTGYLMGEENLLLDKRFIFTDRIDNTLRFCPIPDAGRDGSSRPDREGPHELGTGSIFTGLLAALTAHVDLNDPDALRMCAVMLKEAEKAECRIYDLMNVLMAERKNRGGAEEQYSFNKPLSRQKAVSLSEGKGKPVRDGSGTESRETEQTEYRSDFSLEDMDDIRLDPEKEFMEDKHDLESYVISENETETIVDEGDAGNAERPRTEKGSIRAAAVRILMTQAIMAAALAAVYVLKGMDTVVMILPLYAILSVCTALYFTIDLLMAKRQR